VWRVRSENSCNEEEGRGEEPEIGGLILEYKTDNLVTSVAAQV